MRLNTSHPGTISKLEDVEKYIWSEMPDLNGTDR